MSLPLYARGLLWRLLYDEVIMVWVAEALNAPSRSRLGSWSWTVSGGIPEQLIAEDLLLKA